MEEIYVNAEQVKVVNTRHSTNTDRNSVHGSAVELSAIKDNLTELLQTSNDKLSSMTEQRDLLNTNLTKMTEERDLLNANLTKMKKTCPAGWKLFSCSCYFLSGKSGSWDKGRQDCRNKGADLVVIDSSKEQVLNIYKPVWLQT
ncbi:CD209 antigen-like protein A [Mugil cephalus]|uniref:CD209 antigen-like protein A n=1 Tax=Mugil cephalus TaxID=48193 RepID=UPI001FB784BF|nr:CD209 antigen-like protein A [Mugil cephalus]